MWKDDSDSPWKQSQAKVPLSCTLEVQALTIAAGGPSELHKRSCKKLSSHTRPD